MFIKTQTVISDNANGKSFVGRGAIRRGEALLPGLFRCARCGRRLHVAYTGKGGNTQRYVCRGEFGAKAAVNCIGFGGMRVDRAVALEVLDRLQPLGIEAALAAEAAQGKSLHDKQEQIENALQQARYEATRAQRQFDAVDPDNRLVADELERRWNEKLRQLRQLEAVHDKLQSEALTAVPAPDRERLLNLGADLTLAWENPAVTVETRKRIIRLMIKEIIVDVAEDTLRSTLTLGRWRSLSFNSDRHKIRYSRRLSLTHHFRGQHQKTLACLPTPI